MTAMTQRPNLSKHVNELLILARLRVGPAHGYEIALAVERDSNGAFSFQHGTLYPILHRLEQERLIRGSWEGEGRKRKTYQLTTKGEAYLKGEAREVKTLFLNLIRVLEGPAHALG
ncbi:MAG: helix-turn-helix transcriptional regulator [Gemmatimonadetes bacterium]|jgi:PadR family transcriptional regulator PadR|nr:helix-turn-helix transcriptional regulator [Gemmatimonadota bacterium]